MFRLVATVRRGSASGFAAAWPHYATIEAARVGAAELFRSDQVVRVMVVHNDLVGGFVEWIDK